MCAHLPGNLLPGEDKGEKLGREKRSCLGGGGGGKRMRKVKEDERDKHSQQGEKEKPHILGERKEDLP